MKLKPGTKLRRIIKSSVSCDVFVGKIYTYTGTDGKFISLKENPRDGYSWELKNFEVMGVT